jgi:chromosome segregation ATPase
MALRQLLETQLQLTTSLREQHEAQKAKFVESMIRAVGLKGEIGDLERQLLQLEAMLAATRTSLEQKKVAFVDQQDDAACCAQAMKDAKSKLEEQESNIQFIHQHLVSFATATPVTGVATVVIFGEEKQDDGDKNHGKRHVHQHKKRIGGGGKQGRRQKVHARFKQQSM